MTGGPPISNGPEHTAPSAAGPEDNGIIDYVLYGAAWLLFAALCYQVYVHLSVHFSQPEPGLWYFFSSDTTVFASLYQDLFIDGYKWSGWYISHAPQYLAILVYFVCRFFAGNMAGAHLLNAFALPALLILAMEFAAVSVFGRLRLGHRALLVLSGGLTVYLFAHGQAADLMAFFWVCRHAFSVIMAMLVCGLLLRTLAAPRRGWLIALFLVHAVAVLDDPIFLTAFTGPALAVLPVLWLFRIIPARQAGRLWGLLAGSLVFGRILIKLLVHHEEADAFMRPQWAVMQHSLVVVLSDIGKAYPSQARIWIALGVLLVMLLAVIGLMLWKRKQLDEAGTRQLAFALIALLIPMAIVTAVVLTGNTRHTGYTRYLLPAFTLPFLGIPVLVLGVFRRLSPRVALVPGLLAAVLLLGMTWKNWLPMPEGATPVNRYYPAMTACLDDHAEEYGLRYGIGDYWLAGYNTMFSRKDIRVYSVFPWLQPFPLAANYDWYLGDPEAKRFAEPDYNFVMLGGVNPADGLSETTVTNAFGAAAATFTCGNRKVLVYNRPEDKGKIYRHLEQHREFLEQRK